MGIRKIKVILVVFICFVLFSCTYKKIQKDHDPNYNQETIELIQKTEDYKIEDLGNGYFSASATCHIQNITPKQAEERAINEACKRGVEYFGGVGVKAVTFSSESEINNKNMSFFYELVKQVSTGVVLEKEIIESKKLVYGNNLIQKVRLKGKFVKSKGEKDPYFKIKAKLNRDYFINQEQIKIEIKPSTDSYITVLNIASDGSVYKIFPNKYYEDNFIKAAETLYIPNKNFKIKAILAKGKEKDCELFKIVATKKPVQIISDTHLSDYNTYQDNLKNLLKNIIAIPASDITEQDLVYFISK